MCGHPSHHDLVKKGAICWKLGRFIVDDSTLKVAIDASYVHRCTQDKFDAARRSITSHGHLV